MVCMLISRKMEELSKKCSGLRGEERRGMS